MKKIDLCKSLKKDRTHCVLLKTVHCKDLNPFSPTSPKIIIFCHKLLYENEWRGIYKTLKERSQRSSNIAPSMVDLNSSEEKWIVMK